MTGGTVSVTVTVWVAIAIFPEPSIAVHMIVVIPRGSTEGALVVID